MSALTHRRTIPQQVQRYGSGGRGRGGTGSSRATQPGPLKFPAIGVIATTTRETLEHHCPGMKQGGELASEGFQQP